MRKSIFLSFFLALFVSVATGVSAQTDSQVKPSLISGEVTSISKDKIVLQTAKGANDYALSDKTVYKRALPEDPKKQVDSSFAEISVGDKVIVSVLLGADKKMLPVRTVYLMSKSDISQRQAKELERWRAGVAGKITAINPQTKEITITTPGLAGAKTTVLTPKDNASFLRYSQDSIRYEDAKNSSFTEMAVGDSIRAMGDKSEDGATLKAEKVLTGAFQQINGTITAINAEKGEVTINNIQTKKDLTIAVGKNLLWMKRFPAETAQRMAMMQAQASGGGNMIRPPQGGGNQQGNQNPQQNPNQMGGGNRGSFDEMIERFPTIALADLKVGEMITVLTSKGAGQERIVAFKLLSGVEPFAKIPQTAVGGGGRQGGGGVNSSFTIPGLDGN